MPDGVFRYCDVDIDPVGGVVRCTYAVGGYEFEERISVDGGHWDAPGVEEAARLVFLLAGVSYYKAFAPRVIDLGDHPVREGLREFLRDYYQEGLGEFAYRNDLDLSDLEISGGRVVDDSPGRARSGPARPLVPFGGGMDSIVSVELVKSVTDDASLFVVSGAGDRFDAIERAAAVTGLPVQRATRRLDPRILDSQRLGFLNGHVPVTGILSAIAVLAAVLTDRDTVVMSNEWSASSGNLDHRGRSVNHQYSKSMGFERAFREVVGRALGPTPDYFSLLRPFSELWVARSFAGHPAYMSSFRSCNRAFHIDPAQRLDHWCGRCEKCVFIDLVLSPFVSEQGLASVFSGREPLDDPSLVELFRALIGTGAEKPFECVGDVDECRAAVVLATQRADRSGSVVLDKLAAELGDATGEIGASVERLLHPIGHHFVPEPYASAAGLE